MKTLVDLFVKLGSKKVKKNINPAGYPFENNGELKGIAMIDKPKEGGVLTFFAGEDEPFPGFPDREKVHQIWAIKHIIPLGLNWAHSALRHLFPPDEKEYSKPVREIWRLFTIMKEREKDVSMKEKVEKIRNIICLVLEYDDVYRYRLQDIAEEANLEAFIMDKPTKYWANKKIGYQWGFNKHGKKNDTSRNNNLHRKSS